MDCKTISVVISQIIRVQLSSIPVYSMEQYGHSDAKRPSDVGFTKQHSSLARNV